MTDKITIDRALLEQALEFIKATNESSSFWRVPGSKLNKTVAALRSALSEEALQRLTDIHQEMEQPQQELVAWMFQHDETGRTLFVDTLEVEQGFEEGNPRWKKIGPVYTHPEPQPCWPYLSPKLRAVLEQSQQEPDVVEFRQFLTDVHTAAGLIAHGKQSKALSERLAEAVVKYRTQKQEPVVWMYVNKSTHETKFQKHMSDFVDHSLWSEAPLYGEPLANHELQCVCGAVWLGEEMVHLPDKRPPASKPWVGLTQQDINIAFDDTQEGGGFDDFARAIEAKLREKNTGEAK